MSRFETTRGDRPGTLADVETVGTASETIDAPAAPLLVPARPLELPARIGSFVPRERLGSGGMGTVFAALDERLGRTVAIKVVRPERRSADRRHDRRLLGEAQALARLAHPNVVTVYEVGPLPDGGVFLAMELVRGTTLRAWVPGRPWREVVAAYVQVARGLAAAHQAGLVHGDVKPDNALIGLDGRVRVVDFGLAVPAASHDGGEIDARAMTVSDTGPAIGDAATAPAVTARPLAGTPGYMAPEQFRSNVVDERSDQFGFCVALYEAVYGERPYFDGTFLAEPRSWARGRRPRPPELRARWLYEALERGLSIDPARRYPSLDALVAVLDRERGRTRRLVVAVGLAAFGASAVALGASRLVSDGGDPCPAPSAALRGVWDLDSRVALGAAFARTGQGWVMRTGGALMAALDRHAGVWLDGRVAACRATHVERAQSGELLDRRVECLEGRRRALTAVAALARTQPVLAAERGDDLIASLDEAPICDGRIALREGPALPPRELAARVAGVRDHTARAEALRVAGDLDDAVVALEAASAASALLEDAYRPAVAEVAAAEARLAFDRGRHAEGIERSRRADDAALSSRQDELLADVRLTLALEGGMRAEYVATTPQWLDGAEAALRRVAHDGDPRWVRLELARGRHRIAADRAVEAVAILSAALGDPGARGDASGNDGALWRARILHARGTALARTGAADAAVADHRHAIRLLEATLGADHPKVGRARLALGLDLIEAMGDLEAGERELMAARRIAAGAGRVAIGDAELALAQLALHRADPVRGAVHAEAARASFDAAGPTGNRRRAQARNAVGAMRFLRGDAAGAERDYREALALFEAEAPDSADVGATYANLAEAALALGHRRRALDLARRAAGMLRHHPDERGAAALAAQVMAAAEAPARPRADSRAHGPYQEEPR